MDFYIFSNDFSISLVEEDITKLEVDAVVNAANRTLLGGGGVDGAIHRVAGPQLLDACRKLNGCEVGEAKITEAFKMPAKYIIHTVGPVWNGGKHREDELLSNAYINSLKLAEKYNCETIAFPNISTGVYGFPKDRAAYIVLKTVVEMSSSLRTIKEVNFVFFGKENFYLYQELLNRYFER